MDLKLAEERSCIKIGSKGESFFIRKKELFLSVNSVRVRSKKSFGTPGEGGCSWQNPISAEPVSSRGFPTKDWALKMAWSITQEEIETIKIIFLLLQGKPSNTG